MKKITKTEKKVFILLLMLLVLSLQNFILTKVSASSQYAHMPDICLPQNFTYYDIWLEDYYDIDVDESIEIRFRDPVNNRLVYLPANHYTLNLECFEMAYYFESRNGSTLTDLLRLQTLDDNCSVYIRTTFNSSNELDQTFKLTVDDACTPTPPEPNNTICPGDIYTSTSGDTVQAGASKLLGQNDMGRYQKMNINNFNASGLGLWVQRSDISPAFDGVVTYVIRKVSDNSLVLNQSINVNDVPTTAWGVEYNISFDPILLNGEYYIGIEYMNGPNNYTLNQYGHTLGLDDYGWYENDAPPSGSYDTQGNNDLYVHLFDTCSVPSGPNGTTIPDVYMNGSQNIFINLQDYYSDWEDIYLKSVDPFNPDYEYQIYTGYLTLNTDFYELMLHANGTLVLVSYERPYDYSVDAFFCSYLPHEVCNSETFHVYIQSNLSNVTINSPMQTYYNLGLTGSELFAGNLFFNYYKTITMTFFDDNSTGVLGTDSNHTYSVFDDEDSSNITYKVYINCSIDNNLWNYNFFGDLNVSLECGNYQSYFRVTANEVYTSKVYLTACNEFGCASDFSTIIAGTKDYSVDEIQVQASIQEIVSNQSWFDRTFGSFTEILPENPTNKQKNGTVFLILFVVFVVPFILLFKISVKLAMYTSILASVIIMFILVQGQYLNPFWPVLISIVLVLNFILKIFKG